MVPAAALVTTILASFAVLAGAIWAVTTRIGSQVDRIGDEVQLLRSDLGARIDRTDARLTGQISELDTRLTGQITSLDTRLTGQISALDTRVSGRIDTLEGWIERRFDVHGAKIDGLSDQMTAVRAALAGLDARVATLEQRGGPS